MHDKYDGAALAEASSDPGNEDEGPKSGPAAPDLTRVVGENLRRLRTRRGLSLQRLSRASGVSRAMLSQVELGRSSPTVNVVWKISHALAVPVSALITDASESQLTVLRAAAAKLLTSHDGAFSSRALFPIDGPRSVEFFELRLAPASVEHAEPYPPGTRQNLVVAEGSLRVVVGGKAHRLETGDAILFDADLAHAYCNDGATALRLYVVITYDGAGPPAARA